MRNDAIKKQTIILSTLVRIDNKKNSSIIRKFCFSRIKYADTKRKRADRQSGVESPAIATTNIEHIIRKAAMKAMPIRKYLFSQ